MIRERPGTVLIVGGGLAGLTAGLRLAQRGVRVRVFEARPKAGGSCATTILSGYTFNDGALYLALPRLLDHVFAQLGLDRAALLPLIRIPAPQTTYLPDGSRVVFGAGPDVQVSSADGRRTHVDLSKLIERWDPVVRIFADKLALRPLSLAYFLRHAWSVLPRLRGTVSHELDRLFADEVVRSALAGMLLYTGLPAARTPALQMLGLVCLFTEGFFVPETGMGRIPQCLEAALMTLPRLAPEGGSVVEMFPPIRQDLPVDAWDEPTLASVVDGAVNALRGHHRLDIAMKRVIGPQQYRDDLGLFQGAAYGLSPAAGVTALFPAVTKVRGLFQAGQTTYPGYGVAPSALSGLFAADALLGGS